MKNETLIDLIRHGEPVGGRAYRGHNIDDALSEKGWQQMWDAVGEHRPWDKIITSPLSRCHSFASALAEDMDINFSIENNLKEVGFGSWEGQTPDQIKNNNPEEYNKFYADPVNNRPAGAEPLDAFCSRVVQAYLHSVSEHRGKHILLVAHAGVIRAILAHTMHCAPIGLYKIKVANAGISRIRFNGDSGTVEFINGKL